MTNRTWIDNADQRENLRDRLNLVINDPCEYSYEEMGLARDALCVLDSYETLRAERLNALAARERLQSEIETLRAQRDRLRVALAFYADVAFVQKFDSAGRRLPFAALNDSGATARYAIAAVLPHDVKGTK